MLLPSKKKKEGQVSLTVVGSRLLVLRTPPTEKFRANILALGFKVSECFDKRKYLLANRIFMLLLPFVYFLFLWGPGTRGGIYLDYSKYPLGYLCLPSDQASMWVSLRFILTVVEDVFFHTKYLLEFFLMYSFVCLVFLKRLLMS